MSTSTRGPLQTTLPSCMNASVSATSSALRACSSTRRTAQPPVAQLDDGFDDDLGGEGREAEGRLVGDEDGGRVGERGGEAEHLLLTARQQARGLAAPLAEDRGTGRRPGRAARGRGSGAREVLLDGEAGEDAAGLGDEEHAGPRRGGTGEVGDVRRRRGAPGRAWGRRGRRRRCTPWTCRRRSARAAR